MKNEQTDFSRVKVPPHNLEAEQTVLGAMLLDNDVIPKAQELLLANYFYSEAHQKIFTAIIDVFAVEKRADLILLNNDLRQRGQLEKVPWKPGPPQRILSKLGAGGALWADYHSHRL